MLAYEGFIPSNMYSVGPKKPGFAVQLPAPAADQELAGQAVQDVEPVALYVLIGHAMQAWPERYWPAVQPLNAINTIPEPPAPPAPELSDPPPPPPPVLACPFPGIPGILPEGTPDIAPYPPPPRPPTPPPGAAVDFELQH